MSAPTDLVAAVHALVVADPSADLAATTRRHAQALAPLLPHASADALVDEVLARTMGLGRLEPLLADPEVTEVMVVGGTTVWYERAGRLERAGVVLAPGEAEHLVERVVAPLGLRIDRTSPIVDARLADGSRVHAIVAPLAVDGTCVTIRRFGVRAAPLEEFAAPAVVGLLVWAVRAGCNVLVSGATSSGKTTLLNALAAHVEPGERIVTIEDAAELRLPGDHVVRLEARPPTAEGLGGATVRDLVRAALRMRPDRLVVGEVRGAEALDMVQAMSTGHDGSLSTCHASTPVEALRRVEAMVLQADAGLPLEAVREQLHGAVDLVVQVARGADGHRRVVEVAEVADLAELAHGEHRPRTTTLATGDRLVARPRRAPRRPDAPPPPSLRPKAAR